MILEVEQLNKLDFSKQLVFAYLACERLYPNYCYFSKNYEFGNPKVLRKAIDYISDNIFNYSPDTNTINLFIQQLDANIPEPADYDTILASSALDSCTSIIEALNYLLDKQTSRLNNISTMATDTADMYIQQKEDLDYNNDKDFQKKIDSHPIMQKEVLIQKGIISYLLKINNLQPVDIDTLIQLQENNKGSLSL